MQIFKFGGASVRDTANIKNVCHIIKKNNDKPTLVVVSAMGKTTDKLVALSQTFYKEKRILPDPWNSFKEDQLDVVEKLFGENRSDTSQKIKKQSFKDSLPLLQGLSRIVLLRFETSFTLVRLSFTRSKPETNNR